MRRATPARRVRRGSTRFQSAPSLRRATRRAARAVIAAVRISIRALLAEGDAPPRCRRPRPRYFNPRPPCGGRRWAGCPAQSLRAISIRALLAEGDRNELDRLPFEEIFQSAPSLRRATRRERRRHACKLISIRALLAEGDLAVVPRRSDHYNFNPRPPCGGRREAILPSSSLSYFNPRPPCGGRRTRTEKVYLNIQFQSAPSLRRATAEGPALLCAVVISIRALLAEGDARMICVPRADTYFNPRPPCGGRHMLRPVMPESRSFQSAPSLRRATENVCVWCISYAFQSAPSLRRATPVLAHTAIRQIISIRALLAEGDGRGKTASFASSNFNPRPPCGGRQFSDADLSLAQQFQSAPSLRRATEREILAEDVLGISIRALLAEGDSVMTRRRTPFINFNPRPPCGGRPATTRPISRPTRNFNPRPPCGGRRRGNKARLRRRLISIRALLAEGDPA